MKWVCQSALVVVAAALTVAATPAHGSRIFLSMSGSSPPEALITQLHPSPTNPAITLTVGQTSTLYLWWQPSVVPGTNHNEKLQGLSHDIISSNRILSEISYVFDNPRIFGTYRWDGTGTGVASRTFMIDNSNAISASGSNLGMVPSSALDPTYDSLSGSWRVSALTLHADAVGTDNIFLGVGAAGIAFTTGSAPINLGFGDAPINSAAFNTTSALPDATLTVVAAQVPEPATLVLLGLGILLVWWRSRGAVFRP